MFDIIGVIFIANKTWIEYLEELGVNMDSYHLSNEEFRLKLKELMHIKEIHVEEKIGGTTYHVTGCFNPNGPKSFFQQYKEIIFENIDKHLYGGLTSNHDCADESNADDSAHKP